LRWARERAGIHDAGDLTGRFPKIGEWEAGQAQPTLKQLEAFAQVVHVPVGYLFLPAPPEEPLPIPDFRTHDGRGVRRASPDSRWRTSWRIFGSGLPPSRMPARRRSTAIAAKRSGAMQLPPSFSCPLLHYGPRSSRTNRST
jgi:transcriptional regulator with XRE-family HTH domain